MIDDIRYYPLICTDTKGTGYSAMVPTDSEQTVRKNHKLWLMEIVRNYYRLGAKDTLAAETVKALRPHCPKCGSVMKPVTLITQDHPHPLYACDKCSECY